MRSFGAAGALTLTLMGLGSGLVGARRTSEAYYERSSSVFSPTGRLYQLEYSVAAVDRHGLPILALRGRDGAAVLVAARAARR
eukprot:CAMPEP_0118878550 /NCGR_PEP_ID=MMETSP1163-20130328/18454_1 /TAXON_ID=124430 /ORGANISM="Phaeomonas parva, Strain CCMP2877" /LENGTH=82 /DNA_ID=CAMNT_0006814421 /DNA_START=340 /DNA_END=584 /DNA_ORIENTATION=-